MRLALKRSTGIVLFAAVAAGCAAMSGGSGPMAVAKLDPTKGNAAAGTVSFEQRGSTVLVSGTVSGLAPNLEHGFHVHEKGDCSSGDGVSAGGHFNPLAKGHGNHTGGGGHAGDMPNIRADAYGNATFSFSTGGITVGSGATDIVGRGLIVHRDPDDYKSQPAGNAGPRLACAVIAKS